jgi:hypothetical protein
MTSYPTTRHARRAWLNRVTQEYPLRLCVLEDMAPRVRDTASDPSVLVAYRDSLREVARLHEALITSTVLPMEATPDGPTDIVLLGHAVEFEDGEIVCIGGWCERDTKLESRLVPYCDFEGPDGILGRRRGQVVYQRGHDSAPDGRVIKDIRCSGL